MKIGSLTLLIARPDNLDEQLLASTGCSAAETRVHLQSHCLAGSVAAALLPFVAGDRPVRHTLAEAIAEAGVEPVRRRVLKLYEAHVSATGSPPHTNPGEPAAERKSASGKAKG